jgi:predicted transcriptional regulator
MIREFAEFQAQKTPEPERRGIPKGYTFGPSPMKVRAACLSLLGMTAKEIAEELGLDEDVVRRWFNSPEFQRLRKEMLEEFQAYAAEHLDEPRNGGASEVLGPAAEITLRKAVDDFLRRSNKVTLPALRQVQQLLKQRERDGGFSKWIMRRDSELVLLHKLSEDAPVLTKDPLKEAVAILRKAMIEDAFRLLDEPSLSEEQRQLLKETLRELEGDSRETEAATA